MKKSKELKRVILLTIAGILSLAIGYMLGVSGGVEEVICYLTSSGSTGYLVAGGALVGTVVEGGTMTVGASEEAGLIEQDLSKEITVMNPDRFPLDTMTREHIRKRAKISGQRTKYAQRSTKPMSDVIDPSATGKGLAMGDPCSSFEASTTNQARVVYVKPLNMDTWRTHDTLIMRGLTLNGTKSKPTISSTETFKGDVVFYVTKKEGEVFELRPISGIKGTGNNEEEFIVPSFDSSTILYRMGQAKSELAMTTEAFAITPVLIEQYCQNFMAQIEESTFHAITEKKVNLSFNDMEAENIYSMRAEIEASSIWGAKHEINVGSDQTLFTGGIANSVDTFLEYGGENGEKILTKEQYTSWGETLFTGNNGSKERILLCGATLISAIDLLRETHKYVSGEGKAKETYLGVKCTTISSTFGDLKVVHAPLFDEHGWGDMGMAIDLEHLYKREFVPMKAEEIDLKGSGQKNATAKVIQEVSCMILRYPDCHAIIRPIEQ